MNGFASYIQITMGIAVSAPILLMVVGLSIVASTFVVRLSYQLVGKTGMWVDKIVNFQPKQKEGGK